MYQAIVAELKNVREHPNGSRIKLATVLGSQVVIGLNNKEGELGLFFPEGGILSDEFCTANDLYSRIDENGNKTGGFFELGKPRVRTQKFRGEKSEGFWIPLSSLKYIPEINVISSFPEFTTDSVKEGDSFDELFGHPICTRYETRATRIAKERNKSGTSKRGETLMFKKHFDTEQFRFYVDKIPEGRKIIITEKLEGTSMRFGCVLDTKPYRLTWKDKFINYLSKIFKVDAEIKNEIEEWVYLSGTRNVVITPDHVGYYKDLEDFRDRAIEPLKNNLYKGETIFGEIVGYAGHGVTIMGSPSTDILKDKEISKKYGPKMVYKYGCLDGGCKLYIYRITRTSEDGHSIDLPWEAVKSRCSELGVPHVPELLNGYYVGDTESLRKIVDTLSEGSSTLDESHIREGVCLRVEGDSTPMILKHKNFTYGVLSGYLKEKEDVIDIEEAS